MSGPGGSPLRQAFRARWEGLGGQYWETAPGPGLTGTVAAAADALIDRVPGQKPPALWWPGPAWASLAWEAALPPDRWTVTAVTGREPLTVGGRPTDPTVLRGVAASAVLGVTGAAWAVADTGSVALTSAPGQGLWPSLLPPSHLIVLREAQVVATVADGLRRVRAEGPPPAMAKIISGPSSTADIEGQLWIGVHGPGRVGVVVVTGAD
jgi:hypothetical protein